MPGRHITKENAAEMLRNYEAKRLESCIRAKMKDGYWLDGLLISGIDNAHRT